MIHIDNDRIEWTRYLFNDEIISAYKSTILIPVRTGQSAYRHKEIKVLNLTVKINGLYIPFVVFKVDDYQKAYGDCMRNVGKVQQEPNNAYYKACYDFYCEYLDGKEHEGTTESLDTILRKLGY